MGSWFVNYFASNNKTVSIYDSNSGSLKPTSLGISIAHSLADCVAGADLALVCVPVQLTPRIIRDCAGYLKPGATLAEISSVKHRTFPALTKVRSDLKPLCLHPMFGPGATDKKQMKILVIPVRNTSDELRTVEEFFTDATFVVIPTAKAHDDAIAVVLGLTYFTNLVFSYFLTTKELKRLKEIAGTTFQLQSMLAESILTDEPELIAALIRENPYALKHIKRYLGQASDLTKLMAAKDQRQLERRLHTLKARVQVRTDIRMSYKQLYDAIKAIDG